MGARDILITEHGVPRPGPLGAALALAAMVLYLAISAQPALALTPVVTSYADTDDSVCDSQCTLREAINLVNGNGTADAITFDGSLFPASGPGTITLTSGLPALSTSAGDVIDAANRGVIVDGVNDTLVCFTMAGSNATIVGIDQIINCQTGVYITGSSNLVGGGNLSESGGQCSGTSDDEGDGFINDGCPEVLTNAEVGANCSNATDDDLVDSDGVVNDGCPPRGQGSVISGGAYGIRVNGSPAYSNFFLGNYIGIDQHGAAALSNTAIGISLDMAGFGNGIGGPTATERNVIAGNATAGVAVNGGTTTGSLVSANFIGTNAAGTAAIANGIGVLIEGGAQNITIGGLNGTPGGACSGDCNLISGNTNEGVRIAGGGSAGNTLKGNYLGVNAAGTAALANDEGVRIHESPNNVVGGATAGERNVISGNPKGVRITGASSTGNILIGNHIGSNAAGTAAIANGFGVEISAVAQNNIIGGSAAGQRNVISGNSGSGIEIKDSGTNTNVVKSNFVGTNTAGNGALANGGNGIFISTSATNNCIGGTIVSSVCTSALGAGNLISGNSASGVALAANGNSVKGNLIGTNAAGTTAIGNGGRGVEVESSNNVIGGTASSDRNVISGNLNRGIGFEGAGVQGNVVQGNYIGVGVDGVTAIQNTFQGIWLGSDVGTGETIGGTAPGAGNLIASNNHHGIGAITNNHIIQGNTIRSNGIDGVYIDASGVTIGGTTSGAGNTITGNAGDGVYVNGGTGNSIRGNSIHSNTGLGIDLNPNNVTANDAGDGDTGPNNLMNFPVITSGAFDGVQTTVSGTLDTSSPSTAVVDVYSSDLVDPSGNGEGRVHLGSATPSGGGAWTLTFSGAQPYTKLTATAANAGSTSEFSAAFTPALGAGMPLKEIAWQGQATPIGGTFSVLGFAQVPSAAGTVVFWAFTNLGSEGIFSGSGGPITKLVATGDATPIGGTFISFSVVPVVNNSNDVVFWATKTGSPSQGIFRRSSGGVITKLVAIGDAAPGGGTFTSFQSASGSPTPVTNVLGDVSFWATRSVGGEGVFLYSSGSVSKVAGVGDAAPGGGTFSDFGGGGYATIPIVTDNKQVTFRASTSGGPTQGVYLFDSGSLAKMAAAGDSTPLGGTYTSFGRAPSPNESGEVAFFASMTGSSAGACGCAVFRQAGGITTKLLAGGDPGPIGVGGTINSIATGPIMNDSGQVTVWAGVANGLASQAIVRITNPVENVSAIGNGTPIGGTFSGFVEPISGFPATSIVNNQGQVAFWGAVSGGLGTAGIFITKAPPLGEPVVTQGPVTGSAAPGTNGGTFENNFDLDINGSGKAVFANTVQGGTSSAGVFLFFAGSATQDISLQGEAAAGGGTYSNFSPPVNNDNPAANNGNGLIVGRATTSGGPGQGLYLFFAGSPDEAVALKTQDATGGGIYDAFGDPAVNNANQIAATAEINGAQDGLFLFFAGQPVSNAQKLAALGQTAPLSNDRTFLFFAGSPAINDAGRVAQRITLQGGAGGEGLYLFFAGQPFSTAQKLAASGDPVPDGGTFLFFAGSPAINSDGRVVAAASYDVAGQTKKGLFLFFAGQPGVPSSEPPIKLADLDTAPPAGVSGSFTGFFSPTLTDGVNPEVVARAMLDSGKEGLFLFFAGSPVKTVVKQGDPAPTSDTDDEYGGTSPCPSSPPDCVFPFHAMNNGVQVVFVANILFNAATTQGVFLASLDADSDGIVDFHDNCPTLTNTDQRNTDSSLAAAGATVLGDGFGNACDTDDDNDQFSDTLEALSGTNPIDNCSGVGPGSGGDAWPADINGDGFSDITDLGAVAGEFGHQVPPASARLSIAPDPPDAYVDITDIGRMAGLFGASCSP